MKRNLNFTPLQQMSFRVRSGAPCVIPDPFLVIACTAVCRELGVELRTIAGNDARLRRAKYAGVLAFSEYVFTLTRLANWRTRGRYALSCSHDVAATSF
jgi:hypothetical protein